MPNAAEKWKEAEDVVLSVPEVPNFEAEPLGGEGKDVVVDLEAERVARAGKKAASEQAKRDTAQAIKSARANLKNADVAPIRHHEQWLEGAPSRTVPESAEGMMTATGMKVAEIREKRERSLLGRIKRLLSKRSE